MRYLRSLGNSSSHSIPATIHDKTIRLASKFCFILFTTICVSGQQQSASDLSSRSEAVSPSTTITIPAGTRLALVLTHPIQSRYIHRGDDIYAQITSPVNSGNEMVIPALK